MPFPNYPFPATYGGYNPYMQQYPQYTAQQYQQQPQQQPMTPPTIHAEIIQAGSEDEVARYPLAVGTSQMFITRDEQHIIVKTQHQDGKYDLEHYDKRPPAPPAPTLNPAEYVRKDELEAMLAARETKGGTQHEPV